MKTVVLKINFISHLSCGSDRLKIRFSDVLDFDQKSQRLLRRHGVKGDVVGDAANAIDQRHAVAETFEQLPLVFGRALDEQLRSCYKLTRIICQLLLRFLVGFRRMRGGLSVDWT